MLHPEGVDAIAIASLAVAAALATNFGASGLVAFSPAIGAEIIGRRTSFAAYGVCVLVGAVLFGEAVARTLGGAIAPPEAFSPLVTVVTLAGVAVAMLAANLLGIAQSTSWVTVFAVVTVGVHHGRVDFSTLYGRLLPAWVVLPAASYALTRLAMRPLYPLRPANMDLHARIKSRRRQLRWLVIGGSCYLSVALGANNVANAVGPLAAAGIVDATVGLVVLAPLFGVGATLIPGPAETVAHGIVPLGLVSAAVASAVVGTLLLCASLLGVPQSFVQLQAAAVLAISHVKEGSFDMMPKRQVARLAAVWLGAPIVAAVATWIGLEVLA